MTSTARIDDLTERTIQEFGYQWTRFPDIEGFWVDPDLLRDYCGDLYDLEEVRGARVGEIGAGTGRIVRMLLDCGAREIVAVEPSDAVEGLRRNVADAGDRVRVVHGRGEAMPAGEDLDAVFIIGTLQHIPHPEPVIRAAYEALRPGGKVVLWLYSREGNGLYLTFVRTLRTLVAPLSNGALFRLSGVLNWFLDGYIWLAERLPVPLAAYIRDTLSRESREQRKITIFDQLRPSFVRYYTREDLTELLEGQGFSAVELYHRHGYSWTAVAERAAEDQP